MIYFQSKRIPVLWFATLISVSCSIFTCYMVFTMSIENDLKDYSSLLTMRIWQVLFILLGNALTVSLCWLSNRYVLLIELTNEHQIKIKTWSIFRLSVTHLLDQSIFLNSWGTKNEGRTIIPGKPIVIAPWDGITLANGKKLLIDLQGDFPEGYDQYWALVHGQRSVSKKTK